MTYTVFTHQHGDNETDDIAPGRGGYTTVLVPAPPEEAVLWWEEKLGKDPTRTCSWPEYREETVWKISEALTEEEARKHCGEMTLDQGGIGVPSKRYYTWDELRGRLDVWVVEESEVVGDEM